MAVTLVEKTINFLIDHRAYVLGYPVEASPIAHVCDYVLTSYNGNQMTIIGIIDCDKDPFKRAIFGTKTLNQFRTNCRQFTYHAYGIRLAVNIEFWYLGKNACAILQEANITSLKANTYKFSVSCWALSENKVISNVFSLKNWFKSRALSKMINKNLLLTPSVLSLLS